MDVYDIEIKLQEGDPARVERNLNRVAMQVGTLVNVGKTGRSDLLDANGDVFGTVMIRRRTEEHFA